MHKQIQRFIVPSAALVLVLAGLLGASFAFAAGNSRSSAPSAKHATAQAVIQHTVNMQNVPAESASAQAVQPRHLPLLTGVSPAVYAQRKAAAAHNPNAPRDTAATGIVNTPGTTAKFNGMADSASICPPSGCQPPDQALAASSSWVLQGVNASFAVYNTSGTLQSGWPKAAYQFFGVPTPQPSGCSSLPFLSDPRAFYDPIDGRFWAEILEVEGAAGVNNCNEVTRYWIGVSQTSNPNGSWNVYAFNMAISGGPCPTCWADYSEVGFDQTAIYFSGNMFNQAGSAYEYAESFSALKSTMESGSSVTAYGFYQFQASGVFLDTLQPVENEASSGPGVGLLIDSFNINSGGGECSSGCSGAVVWAIANPGQSTVSITGVVISTKNYTLAPQATEPGCSQCIETLDTRISGTPVYQQGLISFALETGLNNGTQVVPAVFWGQIQPTISGGTITGGSVFQSAKLHFTGNRAASFGALMATSAGNLLMVFDTMSSTIDPGIMYATRLTTDAKGTFEASKYLEKSSTATADSRWGDYEATSYDGSSADNTWFAAQYSNGDWATFIGKVHF